MEILYIIQVYQCSIVLYISLTRRRPLSQIRMKQSSNSPHACGFFVFVGLLLQIKAKYVAQWNDCRDVKVLMPKRAICTSGSSGVCGSLCERGP